MKTNDICRKIFEINGNLEKTMELFTAAKDGFVSKNAAKHEHNLVQGIYLLEKSTLSAREIANACLNATNPALYNTVVKNVDTGVFGIALKQTGNVIRITLPCLLPHYKENNKNIITEPLNRYLRQYRKDIRELPHYDSVVMVVINHVNAKHSNSVIRDNDNYEYKQLINTLSFWFLSDDNYKNCVMMNGTKLSKKDMTEVFIVPTNEFGSWYIENAENLF